LITDYNSVNSQIHSSFVLWL